jgi:PAS domain S-box-containing protein
LAHFSAILESIGDAFIACDANWRIIYFNGAAERITGTPREKLLGRNGWEVFPEAIGSRLEKELRQAAGGESRDFEYCYGVTDQWFHVRTFPREGGGITIYFVDITARKKIEADLWHSLGLIKGITQSAEVIIAALDHELPLYFFQ